MEPIVELQDLSVCFGRREILKSLTQTMSARAIGLLGPNGAGKTTLLHTLLGFHPPASGSARILGHDVEREREAIRGLVGYMPERNSFVAGMTAVRFLTMMAELSGIPVETALERAHEALFFVGLGEARYRNIETFSLGMKQLVKLAQAIVHGPRLLFLDEPTNGLDPPARLRMIRLIRQIARESEASLILSSHLLKDVEDCCDEVLILKDGEIASYCNLEAERKANLRFVQVELRGGNAEFIRRIDRLGCQWARAGEYRLKIVLPEAVRVLDLYRAADEANVQLRRFNFKRQSLEDIFLNVMGWQDGRL
ncbi:MAG TPA: ABC transporter ATP-binding protein [Acidobacteriota bacterium]|nr:ABC transporter ATP-binding protein [Acidobacteriota bacterium]